MEQQEEELKEREHEQNKGPEPPEATNLDDSSLKIIAPDWIDGKVFQLLQSGDYLANLGDLAFVCIPDPSVPAARFMTLFDLVNLFGTCEVAQAL